MATNVCKILGNLDKINKKEIDLGQLPLGDLFRDATFTPESYEMMGTTNNFYSSEYLSRVGDFIRNSQAKL